MFLYGDILKSATSYQEQVLIFLEMLKVIFPGGDSLTAPDLMSQTKENHAVGSAQSSKSVELISRVFSLLDLADAGIYQTRMNSINLRQIDFELSSFCTLLEYIK